MIYEITCTFTVTRLRNDKDANELGVSLCEHVLETFNDNGTIRPGFLVSATPREKNIKKGR